MHLRFSCFDKDQSWFLTALIHILASIVSTLSEEEAEPDSVINNEKSAFEREWYNYGLYLTIIFLAASLSRKLLLLYLPSSSDT